MPIDLEDQSTITSDTILSSKHVLNDEEMSTDKAMNVVHVLVTTFEPFHFVLTMGIGITAGIMYEFPIVSVRNGMKYVGLIYFFFNLTIFVISHILFVLKYLIFPRIYKNDTRYNTSFFGLLHSPQVVFLGCSVMGATTLINMLYFLRPHWWIALYVLWWINLACAFGTACGAGFFAVTIATHKKHKDLFDFFSKMTPVYFLPFVTCTVTAASGGLISDSIPHPHLVLSIIIICIMLWAMALVISTFLFAVFMTRLLAIGLPMGPASFTTFIPLGVLGQGAFGVLTICSNLGNLITNQNFQIIGFQQLDISNNNLAIFSYGCRLFGIFCALVLCGFGIFFTFWAVFSVCYWYIGWPEVSPSTTNYHSVNVSEKDRYFSLFDRKLCYWTPTMWACTFPLGTLTLAFNQLWKETHLIGFKIVATIYAFSVILVTTYCIVGTLFHIIPWMKIRQAFR